jgi:Periplasmic binding protein/short chain dehydrogenase
MSTRLAGQVALITGAASGIGAAGARAFAAQGARVVLADVDSANGEAVASEIDGAFFIATDVSREADVAAAVARTLALHGRLDCMSTTPAWWAPSARSSKLRARPGVRPSRPTNKTMKLPALMVFINDIHALGLPMTQGMYLTEGWYWNQSPESRAWAQRYFEKMKKMPSMFQAADASAVLTYLKAVKAVGSTDADKVMAQMRSAPIDDFFAKGGVIRPDGRMVHDMYLMQVKTPAESSAPWDYYKLVRTIPGNEAYMTKAESKCALWQ